MPTARYPRWQHPAGRSDANCKVFEISHSQLLAHNDQSFDVSSQKVAANVWGTVSPAKLTV